jgi:ABC-type proline/glycine betaine transport system ATPase subunit
VAILGPSGCGKSTLLYMLGGFIPVEQGRILVEGQPVVGPGPDRGIVFQHFALFPWRTVRQNVLYGLERAGMGRAEREECAQNFINLVGLEGFEDSYPSQLSGGMRQRTAIARTLAFDPKILLMDEPFAAVDPVTRVALQDEMLRIQRETKKTVVFVTHDIEEALRLASVIAVMERGRLAQWGTPVEVLERPASGFVAEFVGGDGAELKLLGLRRVADRLRPGEAADGEPLPADASLRDALAAMAARRVDRLPVVDAEGRPLGAITLADLVR